MRIRLTLDGPELLGRTGHGVRIAVVDSGIAAGHPHVGVVAGGIGLTDEATTVDFSDRLGHGTAVAAAIREKAPDAQLIGVKVFDRALSTSADVLAQAIRWAAEQGAQLINLSLGTSNEQHRAVLDSALDYAIGRGALVVAAAENEGRPMFPGALPGAAAVRLDAECPRNAFIVDDEAGTLRFTASGYPRPIPGVPAERNLFGISFAVANTSGFLARLLEGRAGAPSAEEILAILTAR